MIQPSKERLIDRLRDELYKRYNWTGDTAVKVMVPVILAIRHKDVRPDEESILNAWRELREGGKRELDDTLAQVRGHYRGVSPLLQDTLDDMIANIGRQPDGRILGILQYLGQEDRYNQRPFLTALRDEDFIGTLFERAVSDAFRGDDGRYFTPRNIILLVRGMMDLLLQKQQPNHPISQYTVCDPCCGSARFLIYWSELMKREIEAELSEEQVEQSPREFSNRLRARAERSLFGADIHSETAAYGCLNMLLHGDGATNITSHDSLDHFGFFADVPLLREFASEFETKWPKYNSEHAPARQSDDLIPYLNEIEVKKGVLSELLTADIIDFSNEKWIHVVHIVRALLRADQEYATEWETIPKIQQLYKHQSVSQTMLDDWRRRNPDVVNGFDVIITNPPFGRQSDLMEDDRYILCQYRLATEWWIQDMPKGRVEELLKRTLAKEQGLIGLYVELLEKHFDKIYVSAEDEVRLDRLSSDLLIEQIYHYGIEIEAYIPNLTVRIRERLRRVFADELKLMREQLEKGAVASREREQELRRIAQGARTRIELLSLPELMEEMTAKGLDWSAILTRKELANVVSQALNRVLIDEADNVRVEQLPFGDAQRVCATYLYEENGKPGDHLAAKIVNYFGKEWLNVEDIEGEDGYASKVTLVFNGQSHTIYYDNNAKPIVYKVLPKQVLFIEQFLRMVKEGGKVFTVLDTGILSNIEDEYIRRFMFHHAVWHTAVEFPHGAFKAAKADVKTAVVLLEKKTKKVGIHLDYEIFGSLPQYLGYYLRRQDTPPIFENDLGRVVCDYHLHLSGQRLCAGDCPWEQQRFCIYGDKMGMDRSSDLALSERVGELASEVDELEGVVEE